MVVDGAKAAVADGVKVAAGAAAGLAFQDPGNRIGVVGRNNRFIPEARVDVSAFRIFQLTGVVLVNVVGILQNISRQNRNYIIAFTNDARLSQFFDTGQRRRRGRLASDPTASNDRLCIGDLLFAYFLHYSV